MASTSNAGDIGSKNLGDQNLQPERLDEQAQRRQADGNNQKAPSSLETAIHSLPLFVSSEGTAPAFGSSQMIVVQYEDGLKPAVVMSAELVDVIVRSLESVFESLYQDRLAKEKHDVLSRFEDWAQIEQKQLLRSERRLHEERKRLRSVQHDLRSAARTHRTVDEVAIAAKREVAERSLDLSEHLFDIFGDKGLVDSQDERFENIQPDHRFLDQWQTPSGQEAPQDQDTRQRPGSDANEQASASSQQQDRGRSSQVSSKARGSDRRRSRSSSPRRNDSCDSPNRRRYRSRSRRRDLSSSSRSRRTTKSELGTDPWAGRSDFGYSSEYGFLEDLSPMKKAEMKLFSRVGEYRAAMKNFEKRHEIPREPAVDGGQGQHDFQKFVELNRLQVEAEERFRQARRHCNELRTDGDVLYENQESSFADDPNGEEKARGFLIQYCGPDKYPKVEGWLSNVVGGEEAAPTPDRPHQLTTDQGRDEQTAEPELDEWDAGLEVGPDDCLECVAFGRQKERILKARMARNSARGEAMDRWAEREGKSKQDWIHRHHG